MKPRVNNNKNDNSMVLSLQSELNRFDELTQRLLQRAEQDLEPQLMIYHATERLALKERQLRELADAMKRLDPKSTVIEQYESDATAAETETKAYRAKTLAEMELATEEEQERLRKKREKRDGEKVNKLR